MSLKDLLTDELYEEISKEAHDDGVAPTKDSNGQITVACPICHKTVVYSSDNPFRPFCSQRCKLIDLGAWANNQRALKGKSITEDDDAELLDSKDLVKYNIPDEE